MAREIRLHISDNGHIVADGELIDGGAIVRTGSATGRFIFTEWDSVTFSARSSVLVNCFSDGTRRRIEGRSPSTGLKLVESVAIGCVSMNNSGHGIGV